MRKTLVALAVAISVVLLQAPAWAPTTTTRPKPNPNIYLVQPNPNDDDATRTVDVFSDACKNKQLVVTFTWGETLSKKTAPRNNEYQYRGNLTKVPESAGTVSLDDVRTVTCNGKVLPFTGAVSASLFALGVSLLVIGALLILSNRRNPLMRQG
jgi:hypothetical protein